MTTETPMPEQTMQNGAPSGGAAPPPPEPPIVATGMADDDDEAKEPKPEAGTTDPGAANAPPVNPNLLWYVVKVQSNREDSIKEAIERRVKIEGLQDSFGQIVIPTEKVSEMRKGKRHVRERKLLPGYLMVHVEFNEHMLYLFRETSGVGDFVGAGLNKKPIPMTENEVRKWAGIKPAGGEDIVDKKGESPYSEGDKVKVKDGMFSGMEGVVKTVLEAKGAVTVELTIFGRPVPVELEYWQVDFA